MIMSKLFISSASKGKYSHHYEPFSLLTLDYSDVVASRVIECNLGDDFTKISAKGVLQIAPQKFPPFGKAFVKTSAFFVPCYQLMEDYSAFRSNTYSFQGKPSILPKLDSSDIIKALVSSPNYSTKVGNDITDPTSSSAPSPDTYDFSYPLPSGGTVVYRYIKLTSWGRRLYKMYKSLGYDIPSFGYVSGDYAASFATGSYEINALPLLAYLKCYADFFLTGPLYNSSPITAFLRSVHDGQDFTYSGYTLYNASTGHISYHLFTTLFTLVSLFHHRNLYTNAWNNPNHPIGSQDLLSINGSSSLSPYLGEQNTLFANQYETGSKTVDSVPYTAKLSGVGLRFAQSFDRFVKRHNLAGSRPVERIYASLGIKPSDFNSNYVHKVFEKSHPVTFYPVLSNSDTVNGSLGKSLGEYAGYGSSDIDFSFDYKCNDYGYLIVLHYVDVSTSFMRGFSPDVLRLLPFDFWNPDFDGKTVRAIPYCEVSTDKTSSNVPSVNHNMDTEIFGFTNVYDEYRELRDSVCGDFIDGIAKSFAFMRDLSYHRKQHLSFHPQDSSIQYYDSLSNLDMSDPFQFTRINGDRFWLFFQYDIDANRDVLSQSESFDLGTGDVQINQDGNLMN